MKLRPSKFICTHSAPDSSQEGLKCGSGSDHLLRQRKPHPWGGHTLGEATLTAWGREPTFSAAYESGFPSRSPLMGNNDDPGATRCFFTLLVLPNKQSNSPLLETPVFQNMAKGVGAQGAPTSLKLSQSWLLSSLHRLSSPWLLCIHCLVSWFSRREAAY